MKNFITYFFLFCLFANCSFSQTKKSETASSVGRVLPPWTPLKIRESGKELIIDCWGRQYIFDQNLFPAHITSQNIDLLSGPVSLNITGDGKTLQWQRHSIRLIDKSDAVINLEATSVSGNSFGNIEVSSKIRIEYDGLMLFTLKFKYPGGWQPDNVSITIPLNESVASYYLSKGSKAKGYSGGLSERNGLLFESSFIPYLWTGDNTRGLFWFCESSRNWPNGKSKSAIQIIRKDNVVTQELNLGPVADYEFGLQATPVKPLPPDWRKYRLAPVDNSNLVIPWPSPGKENSTKYFGWPEATNEVAYKNMVNDYHSKGTKILSYVAITRVPSLLPKYSQNSARWKQGKERMNTKYDDLVYIEPNSPGYKETVAGNFKYFLKKYGFDGYYLDGAKLYAQWKDGNNKTYYPILAYRELQKALYDSIKTANPNALIISHMSMNMDIPVLSFVDGYVDGEQFRKADASGKLMYEVQQSYLDLFSLDQFRSEFMGKQWGIIPFFLPELDPSSRDQLQPTLGLAALLLVHDVQPWPVYSNVDVWNNMYKQLDAFGFQNATFIPYFDANPPAGRTSLYISAYKKDGQVLVVVSNLSKTQISEVVSLNTANIGMSEIRSIYSLTDNRAVSHNGSSISLSLGPLSYKLLWIK